MIILCVFGKYQYGDPSRGISTEYNAFVPALKRLGHEVIHFDSWDKTRFSNYAELNRALVEAVNRTKPDVIITVHIGYEIWLETLQIIKAKRTSATISWTTDDSWKYREVSRFIGCAYHAITTTYANKLPDYYQDGIHNVFLTQWGVSADTLQEPLPASSCRYSVSFVGAAHGDRKEKIAELTRQGVDVTCFGHGWPNGSVEIEDISRIFRESIISLNFANAAKGPNQIKARTYEVPGAGGFLLTEYAQDLEKSYIPDKEIAVFTSIEDLVTKIQYFLAHPEQRDQIARDGFIRTKQEHTYDLRLQEIIEFALASRDKIATNNLMDSSLTLEDAVKRHAINFPIKLTKRLLISFCHVVFGEDKSIVAARRIAFEVSWRLLGHKTFTSSGWVGRMFPYQ